jgi:hypothetical protein
MPLTIYREPRFTATANEIPKSIQRSKFRGDHPTRVGQRIPVYVNIEDIKNGVARLDRFPKDYRALLTELTQFMESVITKRNLARNIRIRFDNLYEELFPNNVVEYSVFHNVDSDDYSFYTSVKRDLELINYVCHDPAVEDETKRRAVLFLAEEIEHSCLPGMIGYIRITAGNLEAAAGGLLGRLYSARVTLMNQFFCDLQVEYSRRRREIPAINIHMNTALFNHFAERYHVAPIQDSFSLQRNLDHLGVNNQITVERLDRLLAPSNIIRYLAEECMGKVVQCVIEANPSRPSDAWIPGSEWRHIQRALQNISVQYGGLATDKGEGGIPLTVLMEQDIDGQFRPNRDTATISYHIGEALEGSKLLVPSRPLVDCPRDPPLAENALIERHIGRLWCVHQYEKIPLDDAHIAEAHPELASQNATWEALQTQDPVLMSRLPPAALNHSHVIAHVLKVLGPARAEVYVNTHRYALSSAFRSPSHTWLLAAWLAQPATNKQRLEMVNALLRAGVKPAFGPMGRHRFLPRLVNAAIRHGDLALLRLVRKNGFSLASMTYTRGLFPLQEAARRRNPDVLTHVLSESPAQALLTKDEYDRSPMDYVIERGIKAHVAPLMEKLLTDSAVAITARPHVTTWLLKALQHESIAIARMLAEYFPDRSAITSRAQKVLLSNLPSSARAALSTNGMAPQHLHIAGIRAARAMLSPTEFHQYVKGHAATFKTMLGTNATSLTTRRIKTLLWIENMRHHDGDNAKYWCELARVGASLATLTPAEQKSVKRLLSDSRVKREMLPRHIPTAATAYQQTTQEKMPRLSQHPQRTFKSRFSRPAG